MAEKQHLKVEYLIQPSAVVSQVPEQQTLRKPTESAHHGAEDGDQSESGKEDAIFVPVLQIKKEEAVYTKGDLKLQKVSVTENISNNHNNSVKLEDKSDEEQEGKRPKSRIPKLRQAAEQYKKVRKEEREKQTQTPSNKRRSSIPKLKRIYRRSSKDVEITAVDKVQITNELDNIKNNNGKDNAPGDPDEEIDKIFDEIIHNTDQTDSEYDNFVYSLDDAEKLEYSFEEIAHDYEENKLQPINVKVITSETPLVKQSNQPEETIIKNIERRLSLKDIPVDEIKHDAKLCSTLGDPVVTNEKIKIHEQHIIPVKSNRIKKGITLTQHLNIDANSINKTKKKDNTIQEDPNLPIKDSIIKSKNMEKDSIIKSKTMETHSAKTANDSNFEALGSAKIIKEIITQLNPIKANVHQMNEKPYLIEQTLPSVKRGDVESPQKEILTDRSKNINILPSIKNDALSKKEKSPRNENDVSTQIPILRKKESQLTRKLASKEQNSNIVPKKELVETPSENSTIYKTENKDKRISNDESKEYNITQTKVANNHITNSLTDNPISPKDSDQIISDSDPRDLDNNLISSKAYEVTVKDSVELPEKKMHHDSIANLKFDKAESTPDQISYSKLSYVNNITPPNTPQVYEDDLYTDSAENIGEPKILNIDTEENQENMLSEKTNLLTVTKKVKPKLSARDVYNQMDLDDNLEENDPWGMGKVSRLISRIDSINEKTIPQTDPPKKDIPVDVPIKKTVSSRIAMFERQTSTPSEPTPRPRLNVNIKPIIIEEVLKAPPPRNIKSREKNEIQHADNNEMKLENILYEAKLVKVEEPSAYVQDDAMKTDSAHVKQFDSHDDFESLSVSNTKDSVHSGIIETVNPDRHYDTDLHSNRDTKHALKVKKYKHRNENLSIEQRLNKLKSINEREDRKKSKSLGNLDLGNSEKGKVHEIIVRINSIKKIELHKINHVKDKKRPKCKSVLEKIALFEVREFIVQLAKETKINYYNDDNFNF